MHSPVPRLTPEPNLNPGMTLVITLALTKLPNPNPNLICPSISHVPSHSPHRCRGGAA